MMGRDDKPEKRRFPRLCVSTKVEGSWWDPDGAMRNLRALLVSVSEGGALLRCAESIPANARIEIAIKVENLSLEIPGHVRWWRRSGEVRELGIEFDEPNRKLGRFVRARRASAPK